MSHKKKNFLEYSIFSESLNNLPTGKKIVINTINQYSYCIAQQDKSFKKALLGSDVLLPDGIAIVGAMKLLNGNSVTKIAGWDIHNHYLHELNAKHGKCFYLGASESTLAKIKANIAIEFPNVTVGTYSPPFKDAFSDQDDKEMIKAVNDFTPDVLFVGLTAPKQEKWVNKYKHHLQANAICSIGAVFNFYAGDVERPNEMFIGAGFEWLGRFLQEPKRMWKRYFYFGPVFLGMIMMEKAKALVLSGNWVTVYPGYILPATA
jgi:N-acetylglucosaminyldiphosphoundecaprenol N-acetyl-beta-D-mannosaminyltransferase